MKECARGLLVVAALAGVSCAGANRALDVAPGQRATAHSTPLTISASPHVASEPANVVVRSRVIPDSRSRSLTIEWWNRDGADGSHVVSLEGDRAAITHDYPIKHMEAGEYWLTVILARNDGSQVMRKTRVVIVSEGSRPGPEAFSLLAEN